MLSFAYCYEMKNTKAITLMLVAISFHKSALLALATLFIITQPWIRISPVFNPKARYSVRFPYFRATQREMSFASIPVFKRLGPT